MSPDTSHLVDALTIEQAPLLIRARSGDESAFGQLWRSAEHTALGICLHITGNRADALDALQDTQIAAWRNLDRFEGRGPFAAWAGAIARNAARAVVRRRSGDISLHDLPDTAHAEAGVPFADLVAEVADLRGALAGLAASHREALLLWAGGLTYEQVAATMGVPVNTVKVWIHRARQGLRHLLG